jgi:hypothetical protein
MTSVAGHLRILLSDFPVGFVTPSYAPHAPPKETT